MSHNIFMLSYDRIGIFDSPKRVPDKLYSNDFLNVFKILVWEPKDLKLPNVYEPSLWSVVY